MVTEENAEEIAAQMAEADYVEPGYYTVNMTREWHFSKGNEISDNARVDNLPENTNPVYLDVFLAEDETSLQFSDYPGGELSGKNIIGSAPWGRGVRLRGSLSSGG